MSVRSIEAEVSIKSGVQAECTIGREVVAEVHDDVNLETLTATANGSYRPESGVDGWDRVTVEVPERQPVTEPLSVTTNGQYTPSQGVDGFSDVTVNVPERIPVTESLSVTENGTYEPTEGIDGYDRVSVAVPERIPVTESLTATSNGVYEPDSGVDGYDHVTVNVPERQPDIESLTATSNGTYMSGKDGYNPVVVAVPERQPEIESLTVTTNGTYTSGKDGYNPVTVAVPERMPDIKPLTVTENGTYTASGDGYNPVVVNVESSSDSHAYEGEFEGTETGVLTIDTGYEGDSFAKIITIYPVDGLLDVDLYEDVPNRAIGHLIFSKTDYRAPLYPAADNTAPQNRGIVQVMYKYSNVQFSSNVNQNMCLYAKTDNNGMYGVTNCIRMPDNHTLKIFVSETSDLTTTSNNFFPTGIRFKWRVIY